MSQTITFFLVPFSDMKIEDIFKGDVNKQTLIVLIIMSIYKKNTSFVFHPTRG